jgi:hypothetical protein
VVPLLPLAALALLAALPLVGPCEASCGVQGSGVVGHVPPLVVVRSGAAVEWRGLDNAGHINFEGLDNFDENSSCFVARYAGSVADRVVFTLAEGGITATHEGTTEACASAQALPDGRALLLYQCVLHPLTMKGGIVVVP